MPHIFNSYFAGGFECSTHKRVDGRRLDLIAATEHDTRATADYRLLQRHGMYVARDGLRWHLIERERGRYEWSSVQPMLDAARETGTQVVWDLLHYGWPDWTDPFDPDFAAHFAAFAGAAAEIIARKDGRPSFYTPINEISFFAWAAGEVGYLNPFRRDRGEELKVALAATAIAAIDAIRAADPRAVISCAEPLIRVHPRTDRPADIAAGESYSEAQYQALNMLLGRRRPELGGKESNVDLIGVNYYPDNQWLTNGRKIRREHWLYTPLSELLCDVSRRYGKPLWIAETGCEGDERLPWFHYVADEAEIARAAGAQIEALCLYPVLNHLGWDNDRYCPNGLFCGVEPNGARTVYQPLADELAARQGLLTAAE